MSFILDALRKSDQQRQRNMTPSLMIAPAPVEIPRQPALLWYGLLAAALIGAGVLLGTMHRWQEEPAAPAISVIPPQAGSPIVPGSNTFISTSTQLPTVSTPAKKPENLPPSAQVLAPQQPVPMPASVLTSQQATTSTPTSSTIAAPIAVREELPHLPPAEVGQKSPASSVTNLPSALQQEIPKLVILIHSYSDTPKSRFVFINDRKWHEEDYPAPGLKLEQITPDGVIFSYKGYRFRRGINP